MTNPISTTPDFGHLPRAHGLKDAAIVAFLLVLLGAFVAQLVSAPSPVDEHGPDQVAIVVH